jgi:hypothetical protein
MHLKASACLPGTLDLGIAVAIEHCNEMSCKTGSDIDRDCDPDPDNVFAAPLSDS